MYDYAVKRWNMTGQEQIKDLESRVAELCKCVAIDAKRQESDEMTARTLEPDFWDDAKAAEAFQKKLAGVKAWVTDSACSLKNWN